MLRRDPLRFPQGRIPGAFFLALLLILVGCGESVRIAQPQDFPLHATDHPFFNLHWRLERPEGKVLAVGLVEAARQGGISQVILELRGFDRSGQVISRALGRTYGGPFHRGDFRPFTVRLRPRGGEERFELRVWSFGWEFGGNGNGRGR